MSESELRRFLASDGMHSSYIYAHSINEVFDQYGFEASLTNHTQWRFVSVTEVDSHGIKLPRGKSERRLWRVPAAPPAALFGEHQWSLPVYIAGTDAYPEQSYRVCELCGVRHYVVESKTSQVPAMEYYTDADLNDVQDYREQAVGRILAADYSFGDAYDYLWDALRTFVVEGTPDAVDLVEKRLFEAEEAGLFKEVSDAIRSALLEWGIPQHSKVYVTKE